MPHTLLIVHLGLLLIRSHVLITDLVRLAWNGKLSYFNIDHVLPDYMEFTYLEDQISFNVSVRRKF